LVKDGKFLADEDQNNSVMYLQYVATGLTTSEAQHLPLNKILCGLKLDALVSNTIEITPSNKELVDGLINACINHWTSIGATSIEGFRGNWLVRDGLLLEKENAWELTVEKRAYDILINKAPYSFSIIKYPWMDKPLHVTWPY
jgi:hypothetical protein